MGPLGCTGRYCPCIPRSWVWTHEIQKDWYFHFRRMGRHHDWLHRNHHFRCFQRLCLLGPYRSMRIPLCRRSLENWIDRGDPPHSIYWLIFPRKRHFSICWRIPIRNWASKRIRDGHYRLAKFPKDILWIPRWHNRLHFCFNMVPIQEELKTWWI